MKLLWLLVNCNSLAESKKISALALKGRLAACYDVVPRLVSKYFWPPRSGQVVSDKGCLLIMATLPKHLKKIQKLVQSKHSDKVPFFGTVEVSNVNPNYYQWLISEIKK